MRLATEQFNEIERKEKKRKNKRKQSKAQSVCEPTESRKNQYEMNLSAILTKMY